MLRNQTDASFSMVHIFIIVSLEISGDEWCTWNVPNINITSDLKKSDTFRAISGSLKYIMAELDMSDIKTDKTNQNQNINRREFVHMMSKVFSLFCI